MDWDRLISQMLREMIRQFLREPGVFLTFGQLAFRIPGSDKEVLYLVAESRPDLFAVARNEKALKLHTEAIQKILLDGVDTTIAQPEPLLLPTTRERLGTARCEHFDEQELLADLVRCSPPPEALVRNCCWANICRLRARYPAQIDPESWSTICHTRAYILNRQNPRGF